MNEPDDDRVSAIESKIFEAIHDESIDDTMSALCNMIIFQMSLVCADCRKNIARQIRRNLPSWVTHAAEVAAEHPERTKDHHH